MSFKVHQSHDNYGCRDTTERNGEDIELFSIFYSKYIFSPNLFFQIWKRFSCNQIMIKIESHFYSPKHFGERGSLTLSFLLWISFSSMPFYVTIGILLFQRSHHYFTSCLSWPLLWILTFVFLRKLSFFSLHFWNFYFLLLWLLIFHYLYLKMLSHLRTQANFNHSSMISLCKNDDHMRIYSIFSLSSIGYIITVTDDSKFFSKIPREWAVILMCITW